MSKHHSTISRREFMKALGLAGAGLGAAAAAAPVFHDLDELAASPNAVKVKQPWWVKEVDKPTVEIDWQLTERFDHVTRLIYQTCHQYIGMDEVVRLTNKGKQLQTEFLNTNEPGQDLKSYALDQGGNFGWSGRDYPEYFLGDPYGTTPEKLGCPRWQGTPEEASRMLIAAARFYGACGVGFSKIYDANFRKYFYIRGRDYAGPFIDDPNDPRIGQTREGYGLVGQTGNMVLGPIKWKFGSAASPVRFVEFEDVDEPYADNFKKVIPNSFTDMIVLEVPQSHFQTKVGPPAEKEKGRFMHAHTSQSYGNLAIVQRRFQRFMKCLGYHCLGGGTGGLAPVTAWGVWSGLGELSRMNPMFTPVWGTMIRSTIIHITDMPVAPTKPIDAGMFRFCHSCTMCAEACPYEALQMGKEPTWEVEGEYNCRGCKKFMIKLHQCEKHRLSVGGCDNCMASCPFGEGKTSFIHDFVKATVANTSVFDGFFYRMSKVFGYGGFVDPEDWWDYAATGNDPYGGLDTTWGTRWYHGGHT